MTKLAALLILFVLPVAAQTKPDNNLTPNVRLYEPKFLSRARAGEVARFVSSVMPGIQINWEQVANALVIRRVSQDGTSENLDRAEALLKRFDVPDPPTQADRQIEMTIHLIRAYTRGEGSVPPELAPVVKELKGALPYAGFSLIDTLQFIVRDGLKIEDALSNWVSGATIPRFYSLAFNGPAVSADGKTVNVRSFQFEVKVPVSTATGVTYQSEGITTPLTITEGQKQVIGKIKPNSQSNNDDLFIVLSVRIK